MYRLQDQQHHSNLLFNLLFIISIIFSVNELNAYESNAMDSTKDAKATNRNDNSINSIKADMTISPRMMTAMNSDPNSDFVAMMIEHKKRAIELSEKEISGGKDQETILLAKRVIGDQNTEIEELKAFSREQKLSRAAMSGDKGMKGLPQQSDVRKMDYSMKADQETKMTGNQDKDFISMLIKHHEKSIEKTNTFKEKSRDENIRKMAQQMIDNNKAQIEELKLWQNSHK